MPVDPELTETRGDAERDLSDILDERRDAVGLAQEPLPEPLVAREGVIEDLQRDDTVVRFLAGTVDLGHCTVSDERFDTKPCDNRASGQLRSHCRHLRMAPPHQRIKAVRNTIRPWTATTGSDVRVPS